MYNHNKAQQSKNRVHISWDILYVLNCAAGEYLTVINIVLPLHYSGYCANGIFNCVFFETKMLCFWQNLTDLTKSHWGSSQHWFFGRDRCFAYGHIHAYIYIHEMFANVRYVIWWTLYAYSVLLCTVLLWYVGTLTWWYSVIYRQIHRL